jgi:hypothetical protein
MIGSSLRMFARYPSLLVALGLVWVGLGAAGYVALPYALDLLDSAMSDTTFWLTLAAIGFCVFAVAGVALSFGCLAVLERVRQVEMGEPRSLTRMFASALSNTVRALPIVLVWSLLLLVVNAIAVLLSGDDDDRSFKEDALDWSLRTACDAMRVLLFCSLPALAWEVGGSPRVAVKRGMTVMRRHKLEFVVGLLLTELAGWIVSLPFAAAFAAYGLDAAVPEAVWLGAGALSLLLWTFAMLVQQLYAAELYVWHLVWEDTSERSAAAGDGPLKPDAVARPSLLDGVPALAVVGL